MNSIFTHIEQSPSPEYQITVLQQLTVLLINLDQLPLAKTRAHQSLMLSEEIGDIYGVAHAENLLGIIYFELGQPEASLEYFLHALSVSQSVGFTKLEAEIHNNLAIYYRTQEKLYCFF